MTEDAVWRLLPLKRRIGQMGNSAAVYVPLAGAELLGLVRGDVLRLRVDEVEFEGRIVAANGGRAMGVLLRSETMAALKKRVGDECWVHFLGKSTGPQAERGTK